MDNQMGRRLISTSGVKPANVEADFLMIIVNPVPVKIRAEDALQTLWAGLPKQQKAASVVKKGLEMVKSRAVYTFAKVKNIEKAKVLLDSGQYIQSIILADMLEPGQTVALFVVTIGDDLEREASREGKTSILNAWVLEQTGDYALGKASAYIRARVEETLGGNVSCFEPGSGTGRLFGIEQQKVLFEILNPQKNIGVNLSSSFLMVPKKSVSGIYAVTRQEYVACQYCPRERCQNRRKPFSGEYFSLNCEHQTSA
jgi:hypothetical protein